MNPSRSTRRRRALGALAPLLALTAAATAYAVTGPDATPRRAQRPTDAPPRRVVIQAMWQRSATPREAARASAAIVAATVERVASAPPERIPPTREGYAPPPLPVQAVTLRVDRQLAGRPVDERIHLIAPGGELNGQQISVEGSPPYRQGQRYVLFLMPNRERSGYHALELDGRYLRGVDGRYRSVATDNAAAKLNGKTETAIEGMLR
jgi:hypothetical protein